MSAEIRCRATAPGVARARVVWWRRIGVGRDVWGVENFDRALKAVASDLRTAAFEASAAGDWAVSAALDAQSALLHDARFVADVRAGLAGGLAVGHAVQRAVMMTGGRLLGATTIGGDTRLREMQALAERIAAAAAGAERVPPAAAGAIVACEAADLVGMLQLRDAGALGVIDVGGRLTSHAAVVLMNAGIPAVSIRSDEAARVPDGALIEIDGTGGRIRTDPGASPTPGAAARPPRDGIARTVDGLNVRIGVNVDAAPGVFAEAAAPTSACVGLLRTEWLHLDGVPPFGAAALHEYYCELLRRWFPRVVRVRLPDFGGDKPVPSAVAAKVGTHLRGTALLMAEGKLMQTHLASLLTADPEARQVRVLLPVAESADDVRKVRALVAHVAKAVGAKAPAVEPQLETPAGVAVCAELLEGTPTLVLGTNDLSAEFAGLSRRDVDPYAVLEPVFLRVLAGVAESAGDAGAKLACCGDMAARPWGIPLLLGAGVRELSVPAPLVARTAEFVRRIDTTVARDALIEAAACDDRDAVAHVLQRYGLWDAGAA